MKEKFVNPLRRKLKSGQTAFGLWITLETPTVTEIAADFGLDWICIDMEHGALDFHDVLDHLRAARGSDCAVVVRVPTTSVDNIKRVLDLGSNGVLLPLIRSAAELEEGFKHARYPMRGGRGIGGERATRWGLELEQYVAAANAETMVIPLIETVEASASIEEILQVDGLEAIFFGPADLSQSNGHMTVWEGPGVAEDILRMTKLAVEKDIYPGIIGRGLKEIAMRGDQGFKMVGIGSDVGLFMKQLREYMRTLKNSELESAWF